ncbi:GAF domain-containing protein [Leptolyngbya sp. AN02str]|uniref:GAF domain-containing protein n=1 Tax=Leptolyngbya sp. AN02str TaxID=3423363 RepID=UPI003D31DE7C
MSCESQVVEGGGSELRPAIAPLGPLASTLTTLQETAAEVHHRYQDLQVRYEQTERQCLELQALFDEAPIGYLVTDHRGLIRKANRMAAALVGVLPTAMVGTAIADWIQPESQPMVQTALAHIQQGKLVPEFELVLNTPLDRTLYLAVNVSAGVSGSQPMEGLRWAWQDITGRKQTELSLHRRAEQEHLIGVVVRHIRQSLDPDEILYNAVTEVKRVLQADRVVIHSFDAEGRAIAIAEAVCADYPPLLGAYMSRSAAIYLRERYQSESSLIVNDLTQAEFPNELIESWQQQQVQAAIAIPIFRDQQLLGVFSVHQCAQVHYWQAFEIDLLKHLVDQVAIALQQSHLYQQAQQLNDALKAQVHSRTQQMEQVLKYDAMLKRITDKVRDSLDESQILQAAVQELTLVLGLAGCNAALYDLDQNTSTILYEYTHSIPAFYGKVARMEDSPDIYRQLKQGSYFQFCSLYPNPVRGPVAMLACPIFVDPNSPEGIEQTVLGDLWLIHHPDYVFNEFEIRLVQQVANQCAIAIRQARLYRAAQVQVQELERLNQLKDQFLSTVSHELRTPISNVKMAVHMLKTTASDEKRQQYLAILESELAREAELINDLLDLQRLEEASFPLELEAIALQPWVMALVEPFRTRAQTFQQAIAIHSPIDLLPLVTDSTLLKRILAELFNNACKYTPKGKRIELDIAQTESDGLSQTTFRLRNQAEIPDADLPHIFEKFYRVLQVDRYKHGGTGLGLALVQRLVEQLNGTITAHSSNGWTTFTVQVPSLKGSASLSA